MLKGGRHAIDEGDRGRRTAPAVARVTSVPSSVAGPDDWNVASWRPVAAVRLYLLVMGVALVAGLVLFIEADDVVPAALPTAVSALGLAAFPAVRSKTYLQVATILAFVGLAGLFVVARLGYVASSGAILLVVASMVAGSFFGARGMAAGLAASLTLYVLGVVFYFFDAAQPLTASLLSPEPTSFARVWLATSLLAALAAAMFGEILAQARAAARQSRREAARIERALIEQRCAENAARFAAAAAALVGKMSTLLTLVLLRCHMLRRRGLGADARSGTASLVAAVDQAVALSRQAMAEARGKAARPPATVRIADIEDIGDDVNEPSAWLPGGPRARQVRRMRRMVIAAATGLTALSVLHGSPTGRLMIVPLLVLLGILWQSRGRPRATALCIVGYLALGGWVVVARTGPGAMAGPLILFTAAMVVGSLWGRDSMLVAVGVLSAGMALSIVLFFHGLGDFERARYYLTPRVNDAVRATAGFVALNALVTLTFGGAVLQLDRLTRKLRGETEQRRRQEQRARASAAESSRGAIAGALLHNLNNALTVIATWSHVLERREASHVDQVADDVTESAQQAARLIAELSSLGRTVEQRLPAVDVSRLARQQLDSLRQLMPAEIQLAVEIENGAVVSASVSQLHQLLLNLVLNARDAMPHGGTIRVQVRCLDERVELVVEDTGIGMTAEVRDQIFAPFFTTKGERGTGLGLQSVAHIVGELDGSIDVASAPGRGSRFVVSLPRSSRCATDETALHVPAGAVAAPPASGTRVVLAAADSELRACLAETLELEGYGVATCSSLTEVRRLLADYPSAAVVSEFELADGRVTELLQEPSSAPPLVVIAEASRQPSLPASGPVALAIKPFDATLLLAEVAEVVGRRGGRHGSGATLATAPATTNSVT